MIAWENYLWPALKIYWSLGGLGTRGFVEVAVVAT
jgi:hypothetical protein